MNVFIIHRCILYHRKFREISYDIKKHCVQDAHSCVRNLSLCERVRRGECAKAHSFLLYRIDHNAVEGGYVSDV